MSATAAVSSEDSRSGGGHRQFQPQWLHLGDREVQGLRESKEGVMDDSSLVMREFLRKERM